MFVYSSRQAVIDDRCYLKVTLQPRPVLLRRPSRADLSAQEFHAIGKLVKIGSCSAALYHLRPHPTHDPRLPKHCEFSWLRVRRTVLHHVPTSCSTLSRPACATVLLVEAILEAVQRSSTHHFRIARAAPWIAPWSWDGANLILPPPLRSCTYQWRGPLQHGSGIGCDIAFGGVHIVSLNYRHED
jgi:hypothetical protein